MKRLRKLLKWGAIGSGLVAAFFVTAILMTDIPQTTFEEDLQRAEAGDPSAQIRLAYRYFRANGTAKDVLQAEEWMLRAADIATEDTNEHQDVRRQVGWLIDEMEEARE